MAASERRQALSRATPVLAGSIRSPASSSRSSSLLLPPPAHPTLPTSNTEYGSFIQSSSNEGQVESLMRASSSSLPWPVRDSCFDRRQSERQRLSLRQPAHRVTSVASSATAQNENNDQADGLVSLDEADALNEIIMALDMKNNGNLGCVFYIALDETLHLLEDVAMANLEIVETLLLQVRPTTILISARASEALADYLAQGAQGVDGNRGDMQGAYILRNLNSADFRYDAGRDKLLSLDLEMAGERSVLFASVVDDLVGEWDEGDGQEGSRQSRLMQLGTSINLDSRLTIGCAGAVLCDLRRRRTAHYSPNDPDALVAFRIRAVLMFSLADSMFIDANALISLQILQSEYHPNSHQRGPTNSTSGAKESLSIYGLLQGFASTPQGKLKLRQIMLRPSTDLTLIFERHKTLSFFLSPGNTEVLAGMNIYLKKVKNMKTTVALLQRGVDNPGNKISLANTVWAALRIFAANGLQLRESLRVLPGAGNLAIIQKVIEVIDPLQINQVGELITQTVDFEQTVERGRTAVKQGVDASLDALKRRYDGMASFLSSVFQKLQRDLPEWSRKYVLNCIFYPQLGFLTAVSLNAETGKSNYEGEGLNDSWYRMFTVEGRVYYKNRQMKEIDSEFGDAYGMIIDREIEIVHELSVNVLKRADTIIATSEVLGELDSLVALALGSGRYKWNAPEMTNENVIDIEGGRHPLQELVVPAFIANSCCMAGGPGEHYEDETQNRRSSEPAHEIAERPSTFVLTGPNQSGKSVYLKQVALAVYLAHIGCFVPAERARIGLTDRIFTRIASRESAARRESAFATDLRQVAFAMNFATRRSLILIDEFGKGTDSHDGAGLLTALLKHFTSRGMERPKVLAATHFHEITKSRMLVERPDLAFGHMNIHVDFNAPWEEQVTYLFELAPSRSISSFGSRCAAMNGVDQAVVDRAESIMLMMVHDEDLEGICSKLSPDEARKLKTAEQVARAFVAQDIIPTSPSSGKHHHSVGFYRSMLDRLLSEPDTMSRHSPDPKDESQ